MAVVIKKSKGAAKVAKAAPVSKGAKVTSEVDVLIARLKKLRQGQHGELDVRRAIEDGRA